ncbi:MAG: hypothetical protein J5633_01170 [Oscillospiraceae bacterium]|nr:hypothetical protein [Oscillospiraceae bacterium]
MKRYRHSILLCVLCALAVLLLAGCGSAAARKYDLKFTILGYEPELRDPTDFSGILGYEGRYTEFPGSGDRIRRVYLERQENGVYAFLAESSGIPGDRDVLADVDGDAVPELICNARMEDGSHRLIVYRSRGGVVEAGRIREDYYKNADPSSIRESYQRGRFRTVYSAGIGSKEETVRELAPEDFVFAPFRVSRERLEAQESRLIEIYGMQASEEVAHRDLSTLLLADGVLLANYVGDDEVVCPMAITLFFNAFNDPFTGTALECMSAFACWSEEEQECCSLYQILAEADTDNDGIQEWVVEFRRWEEGKTIRLYGVFRHTGPLDAVGPLPGLRETGVYRSLYQEGYPLFTLSVQGETEKIAIAAGDSFYAAVASEDEPGSTIRLYRYLPGMSGEWELLKTESFNCDAITQEYLDVYLMQMIADGPDRISDNSRILRRPPTEAMQADGPEISEG